MPGTVDAGGVIITVYDNGAVKAEWPDGSTTYWSPDGSIRIDVGADGGVKVTVDGHSVSVGWTEEDPDAGGDPDEGDGDGGDEDDDGDEDGDEDEDGGTDERTVPDGDGDTSDTGWHPKFWGWDDPKDIWEISDTGRVIKIHGDDDGSGEDPWDRTDDISRIKLHSGGSIELEPWEKVGPKFRPLFQLHRSGGRVTHYTMEAGALARFVGTLISLTRKQQGRKRRR